MKKKETYERLRLIILKCLGLIEKTDINEHLSQPNYVPDELDEFIINMVLSQEEKDQKNKSKRVI